MKKKNWQLNGSEGIMPKRSEAKDHEHEEVHGVKVLRKKEQEKLGCALSVLKR